LGIVRIGFNSIVARQTQSVNSIQLAIGQSRIGDDASFGSVAGGIEEVEALDVGGGQFSAFNRDIAEQTGGSPRAANEDVAHHALSVRVDPLVALDHLDEICEIEVQLLECIHHNVGSGVEGSPGNPDAVCECLIEELVSNGFVKPINSACSDFEEFGREAELVIGRQTWEVFSGRVDPSEEEVVVAIWESLYGEEPFVGSGLVEHSLLLCAEGDPIDQKVGRLSLFDPFGVGVRWIPFVGQ